MKLNKVFNTLSVAAVALLATACADTDAQYDIPDVAAPEYVSVSIGTVGVEESTLESVSIYPNPVNSMLTIDGGSAEYSYALYNGMGQIVANGKTQGVERVNVSDLAKGVYFLRLTTGTQVRVEKVVVE